MEIGTDGKLEPTLEDIEPVINNIINDILELDKPPFPYHDKYGDDIVGFANFLMIDIPKCCGSDAISAISDIRTQLNIYRMVCRARGCDKVLNHNLVDDLIRIIDTHMTKLISEITVDILLYEHRN